MILFLDRNILANKIGTTAVAIFTVAAYIATVIEIPSKAVRQISGPIMADAIFREDTNQIKELYHKSALNLLLIGGIMFMLITFNVNDLFSILPKSEIYSQGKWVVIIIGLAKWIDMSLGLNAEIITYSKYFKVNTLLIVIMALLTVYANLKLIPIFGVVGSAIATGGVALTSSVLKLAFVNWKFKLLPFAKKDMVAIVVLIITGFIGWLVPSFTENVFSTLFSIGFKSILMIITFAVLTIRLNISPDLSMLYTRIKDSLLNR